MSANSHDDMSPPDDPPADPRPEFSILVKELTASDLESEARMQSRLDLGGAGRTLAALLARVFAMLSARIGNVEHTLQTRDAFDLSLARRLDAEEKEGRRTADQGAEHHLRLLALEESSKPSALRQQVDNLTKTVTRDGAEVDRLDTLTQTLDNRSRAQSDRLIKVEELLDPKEQRAMRERVAALEGADLENRLGALGRAHDALVVEARKRLDALEQSRAGLREQDAQRIAEHAQERLDLHAALNSAKVESGALLWRVQKLIGALEEARAQVPAPTPPPSGPDADTVAEVKKLCDWFQSRPDLALEAVRQRIGGRR